MISTFFANPILAQLPTLAANEEPISSPLIIVFVLLGLSLAPFFLMLTSSFVKIAVVFSMLRTALGTQQIPPNPVITGLALLLTVYIMTPVAMDVYDNVSVVAKGPNQDQPLFSRASFDVVKKSIEAGKEPVRQFLLRHAKPNDRKLFLGLAKQLRGQRPSSEMTDQDFIVLMPAFIINELSEAFQIGFVLFLPFLVIDMVVSNILLSMGMFMVSPITVSFPFKLLLFVLVDGWALITKGLILGYLR